MDNIVKGINEIANSEVAKEVYTDGLKPAVKNVGGVLGTFTGFFNNVVLYPMKKLNFIFEQKALQFQRELEEKYNRIPDEKKCEPDVSVLGPALEVLKYNLDNDEIRIMFENLIANNMNIDMKKLTHPRFVDIIKLMSHNDAVIFKNITERETNGVIRPVIKFGDDRKAKVDLPMYYSNAGDQIDTFSISASLTNLMNLGLVEIDFLRYYTQPDFYEKMVESNCELQNILSSFKSEVDSLKNYPEEYLKQIQLFPFPDVNQIHYDIKHNIGIILVTDFGKMFSDVCLKS